jgi:hypothetical protein
MHALLAIAYLVASSGSSASPPPTEINLDEAKQLVALVPEVRDTKKEGFSVRVTDIDVSSFNQKAYFGFFVSVPSTESSGVVGRYAVNKQTADLWDLLLGAWVCSPEITARQIELRRTHHISVEVIKRFGDLPMIPIEESAGNQICRENRPEARYRHNMPIKQPVRPVTRLASASRAPVQPAAYRRRYAGMRQV